MQIGGRVLVVDDYEPNVIGMRDLLQAAGYRVDTATDGEDALRGAAGGEHDVILLDVVMPKMSGIDVCRELKQRDATGADDFLNKPIDPEELRARVRSLLRVKRLTGALESAETLFDMLGRIVEAAIHTPRDTANVLPTMPLRWELSCDLDNPISTFCIAAHFSTTSGRSRPRTGSRA